MPEGADAAVGPERLYDAAADALGTLSSAGATLGVAESLTGGLLSASLTDVPGASAVFRGGITAYAGDVKTGLLGVPESVVRAVGVVSAETAEAMARGARERLAVTYALSTTGVAGPDPQEGRPVGTVHVAVAGPGGVRSVALRLAGDRQQVRLRTCAAALELLRRTVEAGPAAAGP